MSWRGVGEGVDGILGRWVKRINEMETMMVDERASVVGACKVGRKVDYIYV